MHLVINQSTDRTEQVTTACIDKLYNLSKSNTLDGTSYLRGSINTTAAYEDAVTFLNTMWGPDLIVTASGYYIRFADTNVLSVLLSEGFGDGTGVTTSLAATANISSTFANNTDIVSFDEFKYFTAQQDRYTNFQGCTSLERIDISNYAGNTSFYDCTNLEYFNGENSIQGKAVIPNSCTLITAHGFRNCLKLTSISIPNTVTSIGIYAFWQCYNLHRVDYDGTLDQWVNINYNTAYDSPVLLSKHLYINGVEPTSYTFPNGTSTIKKYCLQGISSLTSVDIPNTVISIGDGAFSNCSNLVIQDFSLPNLISLGSTAFSYTKIVQVSDFGRITTIPQGLFFRCYDLTSVTIPNTVTMINSNAFSFCSGLTFINFPNGVTKIDNQAFRDCGNLIIADLNLPNLTALGDYTFNACSKLRQISDLGGVTSIPADCFSNCTALTSVVLPNTVTSINGSAFRDCTALTSINIPSGVTSIGERAFSGCSALTSVTIPTNVAKDVAQMFSGCTVLTTATFGSGTTHTGRGTFLNCTALQTINGLDDLVVVQSGAFQGCSSLTSVVLPSSLTQIDQDAFLHCSGLQSITINAVTPPTLGSTNAFNDTNNCPIYVPPGSVSAYQSASNWSTYAGRIQAIPNS